MVKSSPKTLALVIAAIKNMRESKGSRSRDILNYISSVYDLPQDQAKRQMVAALKRGVAHGILRKADGYYSLPTDTETECLEVAAQELGLLDLCCRRKKREKRSKKGCKSASGTRRKKSTKSRKSRKSKSKGCKSLGRSRTKRRGKSRKGGGGGAGGGGCGCKTKSRKGRAKRSKRMAGKSRCKPKRKPKKSKTECVESLKLKTDYLNGEIRQNKEMDFLNRRSFRCRTRSRSRSCSRNRSVVPTA